MTKDSTREWRPVPECQARYEVSDHGDIWSFRAGRLLKPQVDPEGYLRIALTNDSGEQVSRFVHRLVALAFHGPSNGLVTRHLDGDKLNNFEGNLKWGTVAENNRDIVRHGRHRRITPRTHCMKRGHELTEANTYVRATGGRMCRACTALRKAKA